MRFLDRDDGPLHPMSRMVMAPLFRLDVPGAKAVGVAIGAMQAVVQDLSFGIFFLLIISGVADTVYGRRQAKALGEFDPLKAEIGLHSKIMGLVLTLLVRGFELWWSDAATGTAIDGLHTHGAMAAAIAVTLFISDIKSIEDKRARFGQRPLPILGPILELMDRMATVLGAPVEDDLLRRHDDNDDGED